VTLAVLANGYREEEVEGETRVVLGLKPSLAPIKAGVFPLVKKDGMPERATAIHEDLRRRGIPSFYDESGAIGRRYRRQDEAGTPLLHHRGRGHAGGRHRHRRDRDTMQQTRISQDEIVPFLRERIG
jgi:glycyl-tRNA synthetase